MSNEMLSPLVGSALRVENKEQLEEFLARPDAAHVVRTASFEEVFFTIKHVGLADSLDLLPLVSGKQVRGFIDLDCWRKDTFVRKPFMEWVTAFIQSGPEETMKAISGIDDTVVALFLKDLVHVYEIDRDDPPLGTQILTKVRYTTRIELEETAYENKTRRLEMHGFVDYYDAMSIYATSPSGEAKAVADREEPT